MTERRQLDASETMKEIVPDAAQGEKFVRRTAYLVEKTSGSPIQDTSKEYAVRKEPDAQN